MEQVSPQFIWALVVVVLAVIPASYYLLKIFRREPPLHREFASVETVASLGHKIDEVDSEVKKVRKDVDDKFKESALANSLSRDKVYSSIRSLEQAVSALQEENRGQHDILKECRMDIKGTNRRCDEILAAVAKVQGQLER